MGFFRDSTVKVAFFNMFWFFMIDGALKHLLQLYFLCYFFFKSKQFAELLLRLVVSQFAPDRMTCLYSFYWRFCRSSYEQEEKPICIPRCFDQWGSRRKNRYRGEIRTSGFSSLFELLLFCCFVVWYFKWLLQFIYAFVILLFCNMILSAFSSLFELLLFCCFVVWYFNFAFYFEDAD